MVDDTRSAGPAGLAKLEDVSEGGLSARHAPRRSLPLLVAPSTAADETLNTIRAPLLPIACWRLNDARFGFDSSFIHPEARHQFAELAGLLDALGNAPLTVFGHADPTGTDEYNKRLSGRRAQAVYATLVRRTDLWEALYSEPFGGDDWKSSRWLDLMFESLGYDINDRADIERFQADHGCAADGIVGGETRRALFMAYMAMLCTRKGQEPLMLDRERFLGRGASPQGKADYQGCSDFNTPLVVSADEDVELKKPQNKTRRDNAHSSNRRVVLYAFAPGTRIAPHDWPCPTAAASGDACRAHFWPDSTRRRKPSAERRTFARDRDTFACRFYHRLSMRSPCEKLLGANRVRFRLVDFMNYPVANEPCFVTVEGAYRTARTNADGRADTIVPDGDYAVMMRSRSFVTFGGEYAFYRHDPVADLSGAPPPAQELLPRSKNDRAQSLPLDDLLGDDKPDET